ncbi:MAG: molybdopterin synthase sulfur carrier subunit [Cytophaga sp.]|nr:molybdopterin synthase sulfur carrier subunit [Cytophaga sp.]
MKYTVKTFGITKDILGDRLVTIEVKGNTVADLRKHLNESYPSLAELQSLFIAVNKKYAEDHIALTETDEIALIPPVSGG